MHQPTVAKVEAESNDATITIDMRSKLAMIGVISRAGASESSDNCRMTGGQQLLVSSIQSAQSHRQMDMAAMLEGMIIA